MSHQKWPDQLQAPDPIHIQFLLETFWQHLSTLPDLINRNEHLLAHQCTTTLREIVLEMMLALNGIQRPPNTAHINLYLGESQRNAIEKTLRVPAVNADAWVGQAVALVVIYRWYAPQLVEHYGLVYPQSTEDKVWAILKSDITTWPESVTTE